MTRYDVESELNPKYKETGSPTDYYGNYHVIEIADDGTKRRIKTFDGQWTTARDDAYKFAALMASDHMQLLKTLQELEHAVNKNVSGIKIDISEWLRLINQSRQALGKRVIE